MLFRKVTALAAASLILANCVSAPDKNIDTASQTPAKIATEETRGDAALEGAYIGASLAWEMPKATVDDCKRGDVYACISTPVSPLISVPMGILMAPFMGSLFFLAHKPAFESSADKNSAHPPRPRPRALDDCLELIGNEFSKCYDQAIKANGR